MYNYFIMNYLELFEISEYDLVNKLSIADLAYIAGLVDGEGCIFISKRPNQYVGGLKISLSDNKIIPWISTKLNKNVTSDIANPKVKTIVFYGEYVVSILIYILPYLILKGDQARLVLDMIYCQKTSGSKIMQEHIYLQMKELREITYI